MQGFCRYPLTLPPVGSVRCAVTAKVKAIRLPVGLDGSVEIRQLTAGVLPYSRSGISLIRLDIISFIGRCAVSATEKMVAAPCEDFWVRISERSGDHFRGIVDNPSVESRLHGLRQGDELFFHADHILAVHDNDIHRRDIFASMDDVDLKELAQWIGPSQHPQE